MKYDFYGQVDQARRKRIIAAQQQLYGRILAGLRFARALEIGPGYGGFAHYCRTHGITYLGVEPNANLAEDLCRQGYEVHTGDIMSLNGSVSQFDCIMLSHVIEHVGPFTEVVTNMEVLLKCLPPDGFVVLLFPDVRWSQWSFFSDYTHIFPTSLRSLRKLCCDLGLLEMRGGHYVGRWIHGWWPLYFASKLVPISLLPEQLGDHLAERFAVHGYLLAQRT